MTEGDQTRIAAIQAHIDAGDAIDEYGYTAVHFLLAALARLQVENTKKDAAFEYLNQRCADHPNVRRDLMCETCLEEQFARLQAERDEARKDAEGWRKESDQWERKVHAAEAARDKAQYRVSILDLTSEAVIRNEQDEAQRQTDAATHEKPLSGSIQARLLVIANRLQKEADLMFAAAMRLREAAATLPPDQQIHEMVNRMTRFGEP